MHSLAQGVHVDAFMGYLTKLGKLLIEVRGG